MARKPLPVLQDHPLKDRCCSCGFLSARGHFSGEEMPLTSTAGNHEVPTRSRERGHFRIPIREGATSTAGFPFCVRGECDFQREIDDLTASGVDGDQATKVLICLNKDRGCKKWQAHEVGVNPEQMVEMMMFEKMEASRNRFEVRLAVGMTIFGAVLAYIVSLSVRDRTIIVNPPAVNVTLPVPQPSIAPPSIETSPTTTEIMRLFTQTP